MSLGLHKVLPAAMLMGASVMLASCIGFGDEIASIECRVTGCPPRPGPSATTRAPHLSADASEVTVPFWCRPPKLTRDEARAITYTIATTRWRRTPITDDELKQEERKPSGEPAVAGVPGTARHCAADCSRFVYLARIDLDKLGYLVEMFYSENGTVRQLTHLNVRGGPWGPVHLSANGQRAVAHFAGKLAIIEIGTGAVTFVQYEDKIWKACAG